MRLSKQVLVLMAVSLPCGFIATRGRGLDISGGASQQPAGIG